MIERENADLIKLKAPIKPFITEFFNNGDENRFPQIEKRRVNGI